MLITLSSVLNLTKTCLIHNEIEKKSTNNKEHYLKFE